MPPEIHIPLWTSTLTITFALPFSWKMFFYAALAFSVGSFIYSTRCPEIIRDYDRFSEFVDSGRSGKQIIHALLSLVWRPSIGLPHEYGEHAADRFIKEFSGVAPEKSDSAGVSERYRRFEQLEQVQIAQPQMADAFWFVRNYADRWFPLARLACAISYLIGFVLMGWVAAQNILYVFYVTFR